jgi:hypothetical protein
MATLVELNLRIEASHWLEPRAEVLDLIGQRRWLTDFLVAKSREGWLYFWNTSGNDPPASSRA